MYTYIHTYIHTPSTSRSLLKKQETALSVSKGLASAIGDITASCRDALIRLPLHSTCADGEFAFDQLEGACEPVCVHVMHMCVVCIYTHYAI